MVKIYVHNKPLFLADVIDSEIEEYIHRPDIIYIDELNSPAIKTMLQQLEQEDFYGGVLYHHDLNELLESVKTHLTVIQAAGGLVRTDQNEILLIFRKGKWDLPKGKLDEGEDLASCALREIKEETGAANLQIEKPLQITYHTYHEKGKHILKESHWFLVKTGANSPLTPQREEDIEKCEWVPVEHLSPYLDNMHASINDLLKKARKEIFNKHV
ncbi:MAG TPA: NUDIX domain-containing protein [Flavisolibacter sp.]